MGGQGDHAAYSFPALKGPLDQGFWGALVVYNPRTEEVTRRAGGMTPSVKHKQPLQWFIHWLQPEVRAFGERFLTPFIHILKYFPKPHCAFTVLVPAEVTGWVRGAHKHLQRLDPQGPGHLPWG